MLLRRSFACILIGVVVAATAAPDVDNDTAANGQRVHRCAGQHGEIVFSGLACGATESASASLSPDSTTAALPAADSCPASHQELRERIVAAIARHDPNAMAGMLRWRGVGGATANDRLRTLRDLVRHPLLAIDGDGNAAVSDDNDDNAVGGLLVRTGGGDSGGVREHAFGVSIEGGCYWLVW
jgi:hypothetical protein